MRQHVMRCSPAPRTALFRGRAKAGIRARSSGDPLPASPLQGEEQVGAIRNIERRRSILAFSLRLVAAFEFGRLALSGRFGGGGRWFFNDHAASGLHDPPFRVGERRRKPAA